MGKLFRDGLKQIHSPWIREIRGKGLMNAIEINHPDPDAAWMMCEQFMAHGLLAKPTHGDKIRLTPPLVINRDQIDASIEIIRHVLSTFKA
jgi:ornithine--oxo-acid transaminase